MRSSSSLMAWLYCCLPPKKVAILAVGLALLAVASQVVNYAIDTESSGGSIDSGRFETELED